MAGAATADPIDRLARAELDQLVASWADPTAPPVSYHLILELAESGRRGRPLEQSEWVPGCTCAICARSRITEGAPA